MSNAERELSGRAHGSAAHYGNLNDLMTPPQAATGEVVLRGKVFIVRELFAGEADEIAELSLKYETDARSGTLTGRYSQKGVNALKAACALIHQDGSAYFTDPLNQYPQLQKTMRPRELAALARKVDEISLTSDEAQKDEGKDSGQAPTLSG